jgi:NADH pyrophosphatase NudC (nudix superfamily)
MTFSLEPFLTDLHEIFPSESTTIIDNEIRIFIPNTSRMADGWTAKATAVQGLLERTTSHVIQHQSVPNYRQGGRDLIFRLYQSNPSPQPEVKTTDAVKFTLAKSGLKFCPECGQRLDQHPHNREVVSCYLHGDFLLLWIEGDLTIRWRPLRLASTYMGEKGGE